MQIQKFYIPLTVTLGTLMFFWFVYWIFFSAVAITNAPPRGDVIVAFGDSLTVGVGAPLGQDYVSQVSARLEMPILNRGVSGNTSAQALARLENDVLSIRPDTVILLIGGNDFLQSVKMEETFKNIRTIVKKIQESGAVVVLVGIRGGVLSDPYYEAFESVHEEFGTAFVPNIMKGIVARSDLMSDDRIHPNDAGYARFADRIYPVLADLYK